MHKRAISKLVMMMVTVFVTSMLSACAAKHPENSGLEPQDQQTPSATPLAFASATDEQERYRLQQDHPNIVCTASTMQTGSLRRNVVAYLNSCGYRLGTWHPGDERNLVDWHIPVAYPLPTKTLVEFLTFLRSTYGLDGWLRPTDKTVDIVEVEFPESPYD